MSSSSQKPKIPGRLSLFLQELSYEDAEGCWGLTVFTTYPRISSTAISETNTEASFHKNICARFQSYITAYLRFNIEDLYGVKIPLGIQYIRLPSASIQEARTHFRWKHRRPEINQEPAPTDEERNDMAHSYFLIIDEEAMIILMNAPSAITTLRKLEEYMKMTVLEDEIIIKVVDVEYDEHSGGEILGESVRNPRKGSEDCVDFLWVYENYTEMAKESVAGTCDE
jgi:hypothetical protein